VEVADEVFGNVFMQISDHKTHLFSENIKDENSLSDRGDPEFIIRCTKASL
jgi:hypothetical protein